jgi:hypothetical protein
MVEIFQISYDDYLLLREVSRITVKIVNPYHDFENSKVEISLPPGLELVSGDTTWNGSLIRASEIDFELYVRVTDYVRGEILAKLFVMLPNQAEPVLLEATSIFLDITQIRATASSKPIPSESTDSVLIGSRLRLVSEVNTGHTKETNEDILDKPLSQPTGTINVYGYFYYRDNQGIDRPIRFAKVELYDQDPLYEVLIATSYTDTNGYYYFGNIDNNDGLFESTLDVFVKIHCTYWQFPSNGAYVTDGNIFDISYWGRAPNEGNMSNVPDGNVSVGSWSIISGAPFAILDYDIKAYKYFRNKVSWNQPKIEVIWPSDHADFHNYFIHMQSGFEWNEDVNQHEYGHAVMFKAYGDAMPPTGYTGDHTIDQETDEGFALREGWAQFTPCAVQNSASYRFYDMESDHFEDWIDGNDWDGAIVEGAVAASLWDVRDDATAKDDNAPANDDDQISQKFVELWNVLKDHKVSGMKNAFWNGWFDSGHSYGYKQEMWYIWYDNEIDNKDNTAPPKPVLSSSTCPLNTWCSNGTFTVCWNPVVDDLSGLDGYTGSWDNSPTGVPDAIKDLEETVSCTTKTLSDNQWYCHLIAIDNAKYYSLPAHFGPFKIDATAPTVSNIGSCSGHQPNACDANSKNKQVCMTWNGSDNLSGIKGYALAWSTEPNLDPGCNINSSAPPYNTTLTDGNWYFHIRAVDNAGNCSQVYHFGPIKIDTSPPSLTNFASSDHQINVCSNNNKICFNWSASDNVCGVNGYSYKWDNSSNTDIDCIIDGTSTTVCTDFLADGHWYFHIKAVDNAGNCSPAYHIGPFPIDKTIPGQVSGISSPTHQTGVWSNNCNCQVTWQSATDNLCGVDGYSRHFTSGNGNPADCGKDQEENQLSYIQCLQDGDSWYIHARAIDNGGNCGNNSYLGPFMIDTKSPSSSVNSLPSETKNDSFQVCWTGSDATPGSGLGNYDIQYKVNNGTWTDWLAATTLTCKVFGPNTPVKVQASNTYFFRSRSMDLAGNEETFPPGHDTYTQVICSATSAYDPNASDTAHCQTIQVTWDHDTTHADSFIVYRNDGKRIANPGTIKMFLDTVPQTWTKYWYNVVAKTHWCEASPSNADTGIAKGTPNQPDTIYVKPLANNAELNWNGALHSSDYRLHVFRNDSLIKNDSGIVSTIYSLVLPPAGDGLPVSGRYEFVLNAHNSCGFSDSTLSAAQLYHISGTVTDNSRNPVVDANVFLAGQTANPGDPVLDTIQTNGTGNYKFVVPPGTYKVWRDSISGFIYSNIQITSSNQDGKDFDSLITDVRSMQDRAQLPADYRLKSNYPNPFNPLTTIEFEMPERAIVNLEIFNILGRIVRTLVYREELFPGSYRVTWDGTDDKGLQVATGVYFYRIRTGSFTQTKKMVLLK